MGKIFNQYPTHQINFHWYFYVCQQLQGKEIFQFPVLFITDELKLYTELPTVPPQFSPHIDKYMFSSASAAL